ncbi:MAG: glycogen/starch synthase [Thermoprotei archaeon]
MLEFENVWMLGFEASNIVKVGGLGEAVYNLSKALSSYLNVSIIMPSHGSHKSEKIRKLLQLEGFTTFKLWPGAIDELPIIVERGKLNNVSIYLIEGNSPGSEALNNTAVYGPELRDKVWLFSRSVRKLTEHIIKADNLLIPHIIHAHDWHSVPAMIAARQVLENNNFSIISVFHIHLLTGEKSTWKYFHDHCGLEDNAHTIIINSKAQKVTLKDVWLRCKGRLEKIGAYESDILVTVSKSFLMKDRNSVLKTLGAELKAKSLYVYNGTDWNYDDVIKNVISYHGKQIISYLKLENLDRLKREHLRKYLLMYAIGNLDENEPIINDEKLQRIVYSISDYPFLGNGKIVPFASDGPLVLMTGRVSIQKGVDILMDAIPSVIEILPDTKILILLLPVWGSEELIKEYAKYTIQFKDNLRIIYGIAQSIYQLAYLASDTYAAPSRWEPFGIMAIESLALGTPVVASRVGGLSEIILDIREYEEESNGILVKPENPKELAEAITSILIASQISENPALLKTDLIDMITIRELRELVMSDPTFYNKIRENGIKRVNENFRWEHSAKKALEIYTTAYRNSSQRYTNI